MKESERDKNRFSIISNQDETSKKIDNIFPCMEPTVTLNQNNRGRMWGHITEALIELLYDDDERIIDLIEEHIVLISVDSCDIIKKRGMKKQHLTVHEILPHLQWKDRKKKNCQL